MSQFQAHGKFLLTGEYLVLKGALALALPLKLGQSLDVSLADTDTHRLHWIAQQPDKPWFSVIFDTNTLEPISTDDPAKAEKLASILKAVRQLKPTAFYGGGCSHIHEYRGLDPAVDGIQTGAFGSSFLF